MDLKEFNKLIEKFNSLKKQIEKLLNKAEDEALEEGVDITSSKFQSLLEEIKVKLLKSKGVTLEEYEEMEGKVSDNAEPYIPEGISMIKGEKGKQGESIKGEVGKEGKEGKSGKEGKQGKMGERGEEGRQGTEGREGKRGEDGKSIDKKEVEKIIEKETKKQLNKALNPSIFGTPKVFKKKDINKLIKEYINNNLNIRIPWGGAGRSFQFADGETPTGTVDGANKDFVLANTPDPVTSLAVFVNTTRKTLTTDYTLSGTTITMVSAPRSGAILRVDYRY